MKFHDMPEDFKITSPMEEWSNGFYVTLFECCGYRWKLMRSDGTDLDGFYTYLYLGEYWPPNTRPQTPEWIENWHIPTFPGTVEPDMAAIFLGQIKHQWERGEAAGRRHQQKDFREVIGMDK